MIDFESALYRVVFDISNSAQKVVWESEWGLQLVDPIKPRSKKWIYLIETNELHRIKIGVTRFSKSRSSSVGNTVADISVFKLILLNENLISEDDLHYLFKKYNYKGEFHYKEWPLEYFIDTLNKKFLTN